MTDTQPHATPQTALDLWNEHLAALADPAQSEAAIQTIYERLMRLHGNFLKNEMTKQAGQTEEAYNLALAIFQDLQQHQTLVAGGAAAIQAADAQRQEAVNELRQLVTSIEKGDEAHPRLASYAEAIRADEREDALNDPYMLESIYEGAAEQADEMLYDMIMETWDVSYVTGDAVVALLSGNTTPTPEQRDLIEKLFATVQKPQRDPLSAVARDLGGRNARDEVDA